MSQTFAGAQLPPCRVLSRPRVHKRIQRSTAVPAPGAWFYVVIEWWKLPKPLGWNSWQAISSCEYQEVREFRQKILLWPDLPVNRHEALWRLPQPEEMLKLFELCCCDRRLSAQEVASLENGLLSHVNADGKWKV